MYKELKPYGKYIETEYDWLGNVPKHWKKQTIRSITKLSNERNGSRTDLELLSVYREYGVIRKSSRDDNHNVESQDLSNYKYVDNGYLVLNKMKMWQGSLGVSKYKGIVSPAYIVCRLVGELNYDYIHYLLRSSEFKTIYNRISYGIRVGQWDMRYDDFKNIKLYIPPRSEQDHIVKFLDSKLAKINKYIRAKKKLIQVLKEQKQALINEAVTKGLNPNVKMKLSGIDWVGDIPEHWEKDKITRLFNIIGSGTTPKSGDSSYYNGEVNWINSGDLNDSLLNDTKKKLTIKALIDYSTLKIYPKDTIAIAMYGASIGKLSLTKVEACCNQACCCLCNINNKKVSIEYAFFILFTCRNSLIEQSKGGGQPNISQDIIRKTWFPLPPMKEQESIIQFVKDKVQKIDKSIDSIQTEVQLINEYRTRLISDVVTGKIDVHDIVIEDMDELDTDSIEIDENVVQNEEIADLEEVEI
ncbi:restriction endonuclease subunit S [Paenibacillus sp. TH7-28]